MYERPNISLPIARLEVRPLALRDKDLPATPGSEKNSALEYENEMLRRENESLRGQIDVWAHQISRYIKVGDAAKALAKETALSVRQLQDAQFAMKRTEREAEGEWVSYKAKMEEHMAKTGIIGNQI